MLLLRAFRDMLHAFSRHFHHATPDNTLASSWRRKQSDCDTHIVQKHKTGIRLSAYLFVLSIYTLLLSISNKTGNHCVKLYLYKFYKSIKLWSGFVALRLTPLQLAVFWSFGRYQCCKDQIWDSTRWLDSFDLRSFSTTWAKMCQLWDTGKMTYSCWDLANSNRMLWHLGHICACRRKSCVWFAWIRWSFCFHTWTIQSNCRHTSTSFHSSASFQRSPFSSWLLSFCWLPMDWQSVYLKHCLSYSSFQSNPPRSEFSLVNKSGCVVRSSVFKMQFSWGSSK